MVGHAGSVSHCHQKGASHQYPVLVFDLQNRLHVPLTIFAEEAIKRSSLSTVRTYLNAAAPFFGWLEADDWQRESHRQTLRRLTGSRVLPTLLRRTDPRLPRTDKAAPAKARQKASPTPVFPSRNSKTTLYKQHFRAGAVLSVGIVSVP